MSTLKRTWTSNWRIIQYDYTVQRRTLGGERPNERGKTRL